MAQPVVAKLKLMSDQFAGMSDGRLQMFIDDAWLDVQDLNVDEKYHERLTRYLAAHLAFTDIKEVSKESAGPLTREYQKRSGNDVTDILSTPFGQEYKRIVDKLLAPKSKGLKMVVL